MSDDVYVPPQRIGFRGLSAAEMERFTEIAGEALGRFGIASFSLPDMVLHSNVTARVLRPGSRPLALRLRTGPAVSVATEMAWLRAVRRGTGIRTIEPYSDRNTIRIGTGTAEIECSLFYWAEGEPLAAHLTPGNYRKLGRLSAELHEFAATWSPPPHLNPLRWDRTMYYEGAELVVDDPRFATVISAADAAAVRRTAERADGELARIAALPGPVFLHGNIEMWNVLVDDQGRLRLLDFEDVMVGQPIHDVAITLYYGMERPDYPALREAFESGYRSVRPWPVAPGDDLDLLMAARAIMLLNHTLLTQVDPGPIVARLLPVVLRAA
ncbi:phosphotransferase [Micromonospora echinospora]|uniref:phosphotransferase n=1 Tax=Micromonospora echinospora TaxID=1877 RepID=UPI003CE8D83D